MSLSRQQRVEMLGAIGEGIVRRFFESQGCTVTMSEDKYDAEKDMVVDGQNVEVKTLLPVYKFKSFCLPIQQSKKCESVDRLIFIEIPDMPQEEVVILESLKDEDTGRRYDFREYFNGESCQFYRLTFLKELGRIQDKNASTSMWNLSPSEYKGHKNVFTRA
jgi:hypothetical protein